LGVELTEEQIRKVTEANTFESRKKEFGRGHAIYRSGKSSFGIKFQNMIFFLRSDKSFTDSLALFF